MLLYIQHANMKKDLEILNYFSYTIFKILRAAWVGLCMFNANFNKISVILWRSALLTVEPDYL
jgi:hypothetical protein